MLKIEKRISYLSPSALNMAMTMPNTFFMRRLIDPPIDPEPQNISASVGSAFDFLIKKHLKVTQDMPYDESLGEKSIEDNVDEALSVGKRLLEYYIRTALPFTNFVSIERRISKEVNGIPMLGYLDASCLDEGEEIPFDWKVSGYSSKQSPKPCYYRMYRNGLPKPQHDKYHEGIKMIEIDTSWAFQTCMYGWLMGKSVGQEFNARIDQLTFNDKGEITVSCYKGLLDKQTQELCFNRAKMIWDAIQSGSFVRLLASQDEINLVFLASLDEKWF